MSNDIRVIVAGNHVQANDWSRENGVDRRNVVVITHDRDAYKLNGERFTAEQVVYVGTWYENRSITGHTDRLIEARIRESSLRE